MDRDKSSDDLASVERKFEGLSEREEELLGRYFDLGCPACWSELSRELGFIGALRGGSLSCMRRARRLLAESLCARQYMEYLGYCGDSLRAFEKDAAEYGVNTQDLWKRVQASIAQEEHAALLKGEFRGQNFRAERNARSRSSTAWWSSEWWSPEFGARMRWAVSGAAVSAAAMFMVVQNAQNIGGQSIGGTGGGVSPSLELASNSPSGTSSGTYAGAKLRGVSQEPVARSVSLEEPARVGGEVTQVSSGLTLADSIAEALAARAAREREEGPMEGFSSFASSSFDGAGAIPVGTEGRRPERVSPITQLVSTNKRMAQGLEVDWMRSRGRVHVIHDPEDQSSIFWIKPNRAVMARDLENKGFGENFGSSLGTGSARVIPTALAVSGGLGESR